MLQIRSSVVFLIPVKRRKLGSTRAWHFPYFLIPDGKAGVAELCYPDQVVKP